MAQTVHLPPASSLPTAKTAQGKLIPFPATPATPAKPQASPEELISTVAMFMLI